MGIEIKTEFAYKFIYRAQLTNQLIEHECDHVFTGIFDGEPTINPHEVEDWKFISIEQLQEEVKSQPEKFTYWFKLILDEQFLRQKNNLLLLESNMVLNHPFSES